MKRIERLVIYAALLALGAMNAVFLLSGSGRTALAEAAAWLQDLGPARAVILVDDDREMELRNRRGRLAWGAGEFRQAYTVAFVDIGRAMNPLMESGAFVEEREALRRELEVTERDYQQRLDALGEQLRAMDQASPQFRERFEEAQRLYEEYTRWGQTVALPRRDALDVRHLNTAYMEMASAVNIVADRLGIDIVLRFIPPERDLQAMTAEQALTEIRLRSAVKYPEALDITSEVLEELGLRNQ
jgi:hypothetical protein